MKKIIIFALYLMLFNLTLGQELKDEDPPPPDPDPKWVIHTFIGSYNSNPEPYLAFQRIHTDINQNPNFPILFKVPDPDYNSSLIMIDDYIINNGDYLYRDFLPIAMKEFWKAMFKDNSRNNISDLEIIFENPPSGSQSDEYWVLPDGTGYTIFKEDIISTVGEETWTEMTDRTGIEKHGVLLMLPGLSEGGHWSGESLCHANYRHDYLSETTILISHELGHMIRIFNDSGWDDEQYHGKIDGVNIGNTFCSSGPYDNMCRSLGWSSQYSLYGLRPFHTIDLLKNELVFNNRHLVIEEDDTNNKTNITIKAIRDDYLNVDLMNGIKQVISIPVNNIDIPEEDEINGDMVNNQKFVIEFRNGKGFDNIAPMYQDGESKGILISHAISKLMYTNMVSIIDIECAVPYPEAEEGDEYYRDPNLAFDDETKNGKWFFGKKVNDWLDDHASKRYYFMEGGKQAWWEIALEMGFKFFNQSLPTDFFNGTDRNMFTPTTRPSTRSWKENETNIAIYIDEIYNNQYGDYADLTIYRNYYSNPITNTNSRKLLDGEYGLQIRGDGYIGENFYVDKNLELIIGDPDLPSSKTTLVSNTNMFVEENAFLQLLSNASLRLENAKLNMYSGSEFQPLNGEIELFNSELNFNEGTRIYDFRLDHYDISIEGQSSFYHSDFNLIEGSLLTLNDGSTFNIMSGASINVQSGTEITLKEGSELVIETGANFILEEGSIIKVEGNAKITGNLNNILGNIIILDNSKLSLGTGSNIDFRYIPLSSVILGYNSEMVIESDAEVVYNPSTSTDCGMGSKITILNGGTLRAGEYTTFTSSSSWEGIVAEVGSSVSTYFTTIDNAFWGINAQGAHVNLTRTSFDNCGNGLWLLNCDNYSVYDCYFNGKGGSVRNFV
ncbi:MAG: hypothetical protein JXR69_10405 [Candidatus Delongbacteria bacterium]|nr:hypothetical protein [Candidatus Delongbacteria bacterium]